MSNKVNLTWLEVTVRAAAVAQKIVNHFGGNITKGVSIYGIPRGGIPPALLVAGILNCPVFIAEKVQDADVFIDDIIDKGHTRDRFRDIQGDTPFYALVDKTGEDKRWDGTWVSFPWKRMVCEDDPRENIVRLLQFIGEDPDREGLKETPARVIKSYETLFGGYGKNPADVMKIFEDGACDEMVLLKDIPFFSTCEHHMLPFSGVAHIAYVPDKKVLGVSKLARVLDIFARRLQIQERIGQQVTNCLMEHLKPKGAACVISATHLCMTCRGVQKSGSVMVTSSLKGVFLEDPKTRAEFMSMVRG